MEFPILARGMVLASSVVFSTAAGPLRAAPFIRGDADGSGALNITDPIRVLLFLFSADEAVSRCRDAADADDSGAIEITDAVVLLEYLFLDGPVLSEPFLDCGIDPTVDELDCQKSAPCAEENSFTFFGREFIADGVFYIIDRSGGFEAGMNAAREQILSNLEQFSDDVQFGILFFDTNILKFPAASAAAAATPENKKAAADFVRSVPRGSGTCPDKGLRSTLESARRSTAASPLLLFVSDGFTTCPGFDVAAYAESTLNEVQALNTDRFPIHTFGVGLPDDLNETFLRRLAGMNAGTYTPVR